MWREAKETEAHICHTLEWDSGWRELRSQVEQDLCGRETPRQCPSTSRVWSRGTWESDLSITVFLHRFAFETELLSIGPMPTSL